MTVLRRAISHPFFLLALILILAALIRFVGLDYAPSGGHGDVSWIGVNALDWVDRGIVPFYVRELYAPEPFPVFLTGLLLPLTGISYIPQRLVTVVTGLIFVALLYPATWWMLGDDVSTKARTRASLLAALAGAVSLHAMYLSRLGMESPPFLMVLTLFVWCTAWAWWRGGWWRWVLAGAAMALAQYVYLPARLLPLVVLVWLVHSFWTDRERLRASWRGWLVMGVVAFVLTLPALILFISTPEAFSARADVGSSTTGGWIWSFDLSAEGGLFAVLLKKTLLLLQAFGISFSGAYSIMGEPMLGALFFIGLLVSVGLSVRFPRHIALAWSLLAMPVMFITDLISGAVVELHALHQMGILPFAFILSGVGLSVGWDYFTAHVSSKALRKLAAVGFLAVGIVPALWGTYYYLTVDVPAVYVNPESGWRTSQIDVDVSRRITAAPERSYLLPYAEYSRSAFGWLLAAGFRERESAITADGWLSVDNPPEQLTVVQTADAYRPRHDARPSHTDSRLWVLLHDGQVLFLPPLTAEQERALLAGLQGAAPEPLIDRSDTEIATFTTMPTPQEFFEPRPAVSYPLDATYSDQFHLLGYDVRTQDLTAGETIFVTLFWQRAAPTIEDYEIFVQLWNDQGVSIASAHDFPYGGMYRTRIWREDEVVPTHHWLTLPDDLPVGRYRLAVGMYRLLHNEPLPVVSANMDATLQVALAPDFRVPPAPPETLTPAPSEPIRFGETIGVHGLELQADDERAATGETLITSSGQTITVVIDWEALARSTQDYNVFVHVNAPDEPVPLAQTDAVIGGSYPTGAWRSGDIVRDTLLLTLPPDLAPGVYELYLGVYSWQTGERLIPVMDGTPPADNRVLIGSIDVR